MPRSWSRPSTFRSDKGNSTHIISTRQITSRDALRQRNVLGAQAAQRPLVTPKPNWPDRAVG
jgi:hypothetical protein